MRRSALCAVLLVGCGDNPLGEDTEPRAAIVPTSADVAVGARHDLTYFAIGHCHSTIDLTNAFAATAFTAFFVANGRLDAALGLPGALPGSITEGTECDPIEYEVDALALEGDAFSLATEGERTATVVAERAGTTTIRATVRVSDGTQLSAESAFRAHVPDRVEVDLGCPGEVIARGVPLEATPGLMPAGQTIQIAYLAYAGDVPLRGYGYSAIDFGTAGWAEDIENGTTSITLPPAAGAVRLSSPVDPDFALDIEVYDARSIDELRLSKDEYQAVWVGDVFHVGSMPLIDGRFPCHEHVERTISIETPSVCRVYGGGTFTSSDSTSRATIESLTEGTCRLRAEVVGGTASATLEVEVGKPFERIANAAFDGLSPHAVWGSGPSDVIIVGSADGEMAIVTYDGARWTRTRPGMPGALYDVWGTSRGEVLAVGDRGIALRRTTDGWTPIATGVTTALRAVHGAAFDDGYVVGDMGVALRFDGDSFEPVDIGATEGFVEVRAASADDVFAIGASGAIYQREGATWSMTMLPGTLGQSRVTALWSSSPTNVWAVTWNDVYRFDGEAWSSFAPLVYLGFEVHGEGVWGSAPNDVIVVGELFAMRWDGERWIGIPMPEGVELDDVWGSGADDVYGIGEDGAVVHLGDR